MKRYALSLIWVCLLAGCSGSVAEHMSFLAEVQNTEFSVVARGEVVPSETVSVRIPETVQMQFNLEWLVPEFSEVKAGDVVARFDDIQLLNQVGWAEARLARESLLIRNHMVDSRRTQTSIEHESLRVAGETSIARTFADFDPRYFSRSEIIDAIGDLNFLGVEAGYYDWQANTHQRRTGAETARIQAESKNLQQELFRYNAALDLTELTSPADGTFVYASTPWGRKVSRGQSLFPGSTVGSIPVKGKVEVRVYVPKVDAIGLVSGQHVRIRVDSNIEHVLVGKVLTVSPIATPRSREDPRKYIIVTASVDNKDEGLRVGSALTATIVTAELNDAIVLPQQAVFMNENAATAYVFEGGLLAKRSIAIGSMSPTQVHVLSGIETGDLVSLIAPSSPEFL